MAKFINPFSDWGFKKIFGQEINKDLLMGFLNDLLDGEVHIADLTFHDKEQTAELHDMRGIIYDIYCTTDKGEHIIVEMQNRSQEYFTDRSLFYAARTIVNQGVKGAEWDYSLKPVYTVCFLNYCAGEPSTRKFRTDVALMDMQNAHVYSDKLRFVYLMLPLFEKDESECENDFERWIYILKNMSTFERMPFLARNAVFKKLAEIADISALSKEDREKYDESIKVMRDYQATMKTARKEGLEKGRAEGLAEGLEEGRAEGMKESKASIARNLLGIGLPISQIIQVTGLSEEDIKGLANLN